MGRPSSSGDSRMSGGFCFGPIPFRAFGDDRLHKSHYRLLGVIAAHDRFNSNGQGCRAGNARLAKLSNANYTALSRAIRQLADWGYIQGSVNPLNRRSRTYVVIYSDEDLETFRADAATRGTSPNDPIVCTRANYKVSEHDETACMGANQRSFNPLQDNDEYEPNIFCETVNRLEESFSTPCESAASDTATSAPAYASPTSQRFGRPAPIAEAIARATGDRKVVPLNSRENNLIEQQAQNRVAELLGGWDVCLQLTETTLSDLVEKQMAGTLADGDLATARTELDLADLPQVAYQRSMISTPPFPID